jgi:hypothetical protein
MENMCRFCGQPVKVNEEYYDVFEGMHWLCFHLQFEHGTYDPDEPCDDPSCPWNRIGESYWDGYANRTWDLKIVAQNNRQLIEIKLAECETRHLPSLALQIGILGSTAGYKSKKAWYELTEIDNFIDALKAMDKSGVGRANLNGMSPGVFDMEIESIDSKGHFVLKYEFGFYEYLNDFRLDSTISSGFQIDIQTINKIAAGFVKMRAAMINVGINFASSRQR